MSPYYIEKIKSFLIVVLFLSTILLLYFFWESGSFQQIRITQSPDEIEKPLLIDLIQPSKIIVCFGDDIYTVVPFRDKEVWDNSTNDGKFSIIEEFRRFGDTENVLVEEIDPAPLVEAMKATSIKADFAYSIPFADFCKQYEIGRPQSYEVIEYISSISYSVDVPDSLFIYDGKNKKYYRLVADADEDNSSAYDHANFSDLIATIKSKGYIPYYPLSAFLGVENNTLIPLDIESKMRSFSFRQDSYTHQVDKINEMAETFFGESFDFVRKITEDNGTIIYMYGYGQKVLIANTDGSFEYKEEFLNDNSTNQSFFEALETALQFVAMHGSWKSLDGAKLVPYLKDAVLYTEKEKSYHFTFGMEVNGVPIYYQQGESIVVDVTMGQVTSYKRNMIDFDQQELDAINTLSTNNTFSSVNMIAQNYEYIYNVLLKKGLAAEMTDKNRIFEDVSGLITNIQTVYMKPSITNSSENQIVPVWVVSIGNINIFFDLYNADPLGYSAE